MSTAASDDDFDMPDEEERKFRARRLFTYSVRALNAAIELDALYINHPQVKTTLEGLDRVFQLGRALSLSQGLSVIGDTGCGKTALLTHFQRSLPRSSQFEPGMGAIAVRLQKSPNVGQVVGRMLRHIKYPFPQVNGTNLGIKRTVLVEALKQKGSRILLIDEAHYLRTQARMRGRHEDGTLVTDLLRELMDEVPMGIGLFGSQDLSDLGSVDAHLASRASARFELKQFEPGAVWHGFVRAVRRKCQSIDLGFFDSRDEVERLHRATSGNLRSFKRLITEAVLVAVDAGCSAVDIDHLKLAFSRVHGTDSAGNPYGQ